MERRHLCEVVTGCVDYGYSLTPINVSKKISPDSRGTLVRPWLRRCRHSQTGFRGQARMSENMGLGILVRCTSRGRRGTLEPVMRYFVAGAGLGRFRSLIPCACHATDQAISALHLKTKSSRASWTSRNDGRFRSTLTANGAHTKNTLERSQHCHPKWGLLRADAC